MFVVCFLCVHEYIHVYIHVQQCQRRPSSFNLDRDAVQLPSNAGSSLILMQHFIAQGCASSWTLPMTQSAVRVRIRAPAFVQAPFYARIAHHQSMTRHVMYFPQRLGSRCCVTKVRPLALLLESAEVGTGRHDTDTGI